MAKNATLFNSALMATAIGAELNEDQLIDLICQESPIEDDSMRAAMENAPYFPLISQMANYYYANGRDDSLDIRRMKEWIKAQLAQLDNQLTKEEPALAF